MKFLFDDDDNQNIGRYGAPDLRLDGVLAVDQKLLDAKVLFDPFEEQFDLPTILVKRGDCQWWQYKIVGQEYEGLFAPRKLPKNEEFVFKSAPNKIGR